MTLLDVVTTEAKRTGLQPSLLVGIIENAMQKIYLGRGDLVTVNISMSADEPIVVTRTRIVGDEIYVDVLPDPIKPRPTYIRNLIDNYLRDEVNRHGWHLCEIVGQGEHDDYAMVEVQSGPMAGTLAVLPFSRTSALDAGRWPRGRIGYAVLFHKNLEIFDGAESWRAVQCDWLATRMDSLFLTKLVEHFFGRIVHSDIAGNTGLIAVPYGENVNDLIGSGGQYVQQIAKIAGLQRVHVVRLPEDRGSPIKLVRHAVAHGSKSVLGVTFTKRSAMEMRKRVKTLLGNSDMPAVEVGTFHALAYAQLKRYMSFKLVSDLDSRALILRCRSEARLPFDDESALMLVNRVKTNPDFLSVLPPAYDLAHVTRLLALYNEKLALHQSLDMNDLIPAHLRAIRENKVPPYPVKDLLVDEYQDCDPMQLLWLFAHTKAGAMLTAVGDDDQAIYRFRNSLGVDAFRRLFTELNPAVFHLSQNYRCGQIIVKTAATVVGNNRNRLEKQLLSAAKREGRVRAYQFDTPDDEDVAISDFCHHLYTLAREKNTKPPTIAVLSRINRRLADVEIILRGRGLPVRMSDTNSLLNTPHIAQTLSAIKFGFQAADKLSLLQAVSITGMSDDAVASIERAFLPINDPSDLMDAMYEKRLIERFAPTDQTLWREFRLVAVNWLDACQAYGDDVDAEGNIAPPHAGALRDLLAYFSSIRPSERKTADIERLGRVLDSLKGSLQDRVRLLEQGSPQKQNDNSAIDLMTVHSSKGLEFDFVWVCGLSDNQFPLEDSDIEEERRLFYVGVVSEFGKNRTLSRWHGRFARKRSFSRSRREKAGRASAGLTCPILENSSRIESPGLPSFENRQNSHSSGVRHPQSRANAGSRIP
jgi:superfamily I DNA/RNA helicase